MGEACEVRAERMTETLGTARKWTEPLRPGRNSSGPVPFGQPVRFWPYQGTVFHRDRRCGRRVKEQGSGVDISASGGVNSQVVTCSSSHAAVCALESCGGSGWTSRLFCPSVHSSWLWVQLTEWRHVQPNVPLTPRLERAPSRDTLSRLLWRQRG